MLIEFMNIDGIAQEGDVVCNKISRVQQLWKGREICERDRGAAREEGKVGKVSRF